MVSAGIASAALRRPPGRPQPGVAGAVAAGAPCPWSGPGMSVLPSACLFPDWLSSAMTSYAPWPARGRPPGQRPPLTRAIRPEAQPGPGCCSGFGAIAELAKAVVAPGEHGALGGQRIAVGAARADRSHPGACGQGDPDWLVAAGAGAVAELPESVVSPGEQCPAGEQHEAVAAAREQRGHVPERRSAHQDEDPHGRIAVSGGAVAELPVAIDPPGEQAVGGERETMRAAGARALTRTPVGSLTLTGVSLLPVLPSPSCPRRHCPKPARDPWMCGRGRSPARR